MYSQVRRAAFFNETGKIVGGAHFRRPRRYVRMIVIFLTCFASKIADAPCPARCEKSARAVCVCVCVLTLVDTAGF